MPRLGYWFSEAPAARLYHGVPPAPLVWHKTSLLLAFGESGRFVRGTGNSQSACSPSPSLSPSPTQGGRVRGPLSDAQCIQRAEAITAWAVARGVLPGSRDARPLVPDRAPSPRPAESREPREATESRRSRVRSPRSPTCP